MLEFIDATSYIKPSVRVGNQTYYVQGGTAIGGTPLTAENLNKAQEVDYSTDEVKIGKWIDGNDLYRKIVTIPISSTTQGTWKSDTTKIIYGDFVAIEWAIAKQADGVKKFALPFIAEGNISASISCYLWGDTLTVRNSIASMAGATVYISVIYTKN